MKNRKTAYELSRSQVSTPQDVVTLFWRLTRRYRRHVDRVLDLGAGDGRFSIGGHYSKYEGLEIDATRRPMAVLPKDAMIRYGCAFRDDGSGYAACIGNPPYVRHHHLEKHWRDTIAARLQSETGLQMNRKCNLYVYFIILALLKSRDDGLVSVVVPYEWVSRPSAEPLRAFIRKNQWHVDAYRFTQPIFDGVLTTASISVIDKRNRDGQWRYFKLSLDGKVAEMRQPTGSYRRLLPYERRGRLWAMRGMSPGTQDVFTLTEGERIHAGLTHADVLPCVTSLRGIPPEHSHLTHAAFRSRFINAGAKCWLVRSHIDILSPSLQAYLGSVPTERRSTSTCTTRDPWYRYQLMPRPQLLVSSGFTAFGPKILVNVVGAYAVGAVSGIYAGKGFGLTRLRNHLVGINFEKRVVPHAGQLRKVEIRQFNAALNEYHKLETQHA